MRQLGTHTLTLPPRIWDGDGENTTSLPTILGFKHPKPTHRPGLPGLPRDVSARRPGCALGRDVVPHLVIQTRDRGAGPRLGGPYRGVRARGARAAEPCPGSQVPSPRNVGGPGGEGGKAGALPLPAVGGGVGGAARARAGRGRGLPRRAARGRGARPPPGRRGGRKR